MGSRFNVAHRLLVARACVEGFCQVMAVSKPVLLSKLRTDLKRFAVQLTMHGAIFEGKFRKDGAEHPYAAWAGVDGEGGRVSLSFFGESLAQLKEKDVHTGDEVLFKGGQVRIKDKDHSLSSGKHDLVFDK